MTPTASVELNRLIDGALSARSRLGYVVLLLAASTMTAVIDALWITEPALPGRTQLAFAVMTVIGLSWVGFAVWVLTCRRPLLARHSIVAGRMAVAFTSLFIAGALAVGYTTGGTAPYAAAGVGAAMLVAALVVLIRARRTFSRLMERRVMLEQERAKVGR
jgi:hypothetical protein